MLCFEIRRTTSHHWNDRRGGLNTQRRVGVSETFITFLIPHQRKSSRKYKIFINQTLINEVNIVNSVQPLQGILSMVLAVRILGLQRKARPVRALNYYSDAFEDLAFWLQKGFWTTWNLTSICAYGTIRGSNRNRFTSEEDSCSLWKRQEKSF